ncbi:MAG: hypothetical protein JNJ58_02965 [Chitinophagaceae bacterium]|nr:hypothetical protein [Chitinophagaceae bacterium]
MDQLINPVQIKKIAENLECGMSGYWNKYTGELICLPDIEPHDDHYSLYNEDFQKIKKHSKDYIEFERPSSRESFKIMEGFTEQLSDQNPLKSRLIQALYHKKPFQGFKHLIENSHEYRMQWFEYRNSQYLLLVINILNASSEDENAADALA